MDVWNRNQYQRHMLENLVICGSAYSLSLPVLVCGIDPLFHKVSSSWSSGLLALVGILGMVFLDMASTAVGSIFKESDRWFQSSW